MSTSGNSGAAEGVDREALDWALRMTDPDADWDAFTSWLEADPGRAARYDVAASALDQVTKVVARQAQAAPVAANDVDLPIAEQATGKATRRLWLSGAMAAAVAGLFGLNTWYQRDQTYTVETRLGEQRTVDLADGSSVVLAGGSRVQLDRARPRSATVEAGEMLFIVRHDEAAPFRVRVGEMNLVDLGTVFNVQKLARTTRVAVAEGAVAVERGGDELRLDPGQAAVLDGANLRREQQDVADVGSWRRGLLSFNGATMNEVVEALSRNLGLRIEAAPAIRGRVFNGTLEVTALRQDPALLGGLLDVRVRRDGDVWTLDERR